jgi:hypothetical protein
MSKPKTRVPRRPTPHQENTTAMPNERIETSGQLTWLRADRLTVDPEYQRTIQKRKVRQIARDFDPDAFGVLYVSKRADGTHVIIDGQQRHAAVMLMGWGDQRVPAQVFTNLSKAHEAELFRRYNEVRTKPRPLDLHRAAIVARDKRALAIEKILQDHGLKFSNGPVHGSVQSVVALQSIFDNAGQRTLEKTITISLKAWGASHEGLTGEVLTAIAIILARHGGDVDDGRLVRVISKMDPAGLVRKARVLKADLGAVSGGSGTPRLAGIVAAMVIKAYNVRLKEADRITWDAEATGVNFWKPRS